MNDVFFFIPLVLLALGIVLFLLMRRRAKSFGSLAGNRVYQDTEVSPAEVLYAKSLPLCGKPDYLIQEKDMIIPVEVKTGRTPNSPYLNHTMQLMAYCYIVHEVYGIRPKGGILKYPGAEFKIAYSQKAEESVKELVEEILDAKSKGIEFSCKHPEHNG